MNINTKNEKVMRRTITIAIIGTLLAGCAESSPKRPITIEDQITVRTPSQAVISPDGRLVAYMLKTPSLSENSYTYDLYVVGTDGRSAPKKLAGSEAQAGNMSDYKDQSPTWAPTSDRLVYVLPKGEGTEIRTVDIENGREEVLVTQEMIGDGYGFEPPLSGMSLAFSPDGRQLAFLASRKDEPAPAEKSTRAIEAHEDWTPAELLQKYRHRPVRQLFVMELATQRIAELTDRSISVSALDWSPDSKRIVVEAASEPQRIASYMSGDIYVVDVAATSVRPVVKMPGWDMAPKFSPDGMLIAYGSQRGAEAWMYTSTLAIVPADGSAPPRYLEELDRIAGGRVNPKRWSSDGKSIDVSVWHDLSRHLFRVDVADGNTQRLTPRTDRHYDAYSYSSDGNKVAFIAQGAATPPDVFVSDANTIEPLQLTRANPQWDAISVPTVERLKYKSSDGKWDINGVVFKPSNYQAGKRYPLLLNVLGGPQMVQQELNLVYHYPLLTLAEQGYVIFMPNTRGREGYGMDFTYAIRDEKSYVLNPMSDALRGVDMLIEQGVADPQRLGVLGFSYGGTLTANIITHTDRFKAAIYGEGSPNVLQDILGYGASEFLGLNRDMWGFGNPYDPAVQKSAFEQTAVHRLDKVRTPVIVEAGELSTWEGDRQFYRGLKHFGVPAEFFVYPRSGHGWGEPLLKQDAFRRHIAWFDYWIKGKPYPDKKKQAEYDAWRKQVPR